jgi:5-methylcytosine-specific restriction endonuclease McrA
MALSKKIRENIWLKYNKHCAYCGKELEYKEMQVDHIRPQKIFYWGKKESIPPYHVDDEQNLNPSCRRCNHYKRTRTLEGFRKLMITLHERIIDNYINKVAIDYGIIVEVKAFDGVFYYEKIECYETVPL